MQSWSAGSPPRGPQRWPAIVAERRAAIAAWAKHDTPPALGPVPDIIDDPAIVMLWGITRESLDAWLTPEDGGELERAEGVRGVARRGRRHRARREVGRRDLPAEGWRHPRLPGDEPDLVADLPQDRRRGVGHRRLDEPCGDRRARIRPAGGGRHRHARRVASRMASASASMAAAASSRCSTDGAPCDRQPDRLVRRHRPCRPADRGRQGRLAGRADPRRHRGAAGLRGADGGLRTLHRGARARGAGATRRSRRCAADDLDAITRVSEQLRARVEAATLPEALRGELRAAHARALRRGSAAPLAVRSSATTEDAEDASFAGLQDTYLWVKGVDRHRATASRLLGEPVFGAIDHLPAQAGPAGSRASRWRSSCRQMVDARTAGVMFTRSPTTGDRSVIVDRGRVGAGIRRGQRRGDAGPLRGRQDHRRDHRARHPRQACAACAAARGRHARGGHAGGRSATSPASRTRN